MLQPRQPVPLIGAKRAGFRYNRRDIQFDERFEAVSPADAKVLVRAKLARHPDDVGTDDDDERRRPPPPELAGRARDVTATRGEDRSSTAENGAGIPTPEVTLPDPASVASSTHNAPELGVPAKPAKKRVRSKAKAKAPDSAPQP